MLTLTNLRAIPLGLAALAVLAGLLIPAPPARAQLGSADIHGRTPQVVDPGLIDFGDRPVYLYGLRGPHPEETCPLHGGTWACGQEARWAAQHRIADHWVECVVRARGAGDEIFAVCYLGGVGGPELNTWLVEQGWARAARDYTQAYTAAEDSARAAGRGLWR